MLGKSPKITSHLAVRNCFPDFLSPEVCFWICSFEKTCMIPWEQKKVFVAALPWYKKGLFCYQFSNFNEHTFFAEQCLALKRLACPTRTLHYLKFRLLSLNDPAKDGLCSAVLARLVTSYNTWIRWVWVWWTQTAGTVDWTTSTEIKSHACLTVISDDDSWAIDSRMMRYHLLRYHRDCTSQKEADTCQWILLDKLKLNVLLQSDKQKKRNTAKLPKPNITFVHGVNKSKRLSSNSTPLTMSIVTCGITLKACKAEQ